MNEPEETCEQADRGLSASSTPADAGGLQKASDRLPVAKVLVGTSTLLAALLLLRFFVPYLAEEIQYAITRGRQRAEYEAASVRLKQSSLQELSQSSQWIMQTIAPSVVHIRTRPIEVAGEPDGDERLLDHEYFQSIGHGSGIVLDGEGYVLTNCHVVEGTVSIDVQLSDQRQLPGRIVGMDPVTDLAVLKIDGHGFMPARWGDSDVLREGALVWAVGSPFGLAQSITSGIISARSRSRFAGNALQDFLQTDVAVNPGSSGGPLVDATGSVVGIVTAISGHQYRGVSFAIPSNVAQHVYQRLRSDGLVRRGWLGVQLAETSDADTDAAASADTLTRTRGVRIVRTVDLGDMQSPARQAGLQDGDTIVRWAGQAIQSCDQLIRLIALAGVGSRVEVAIVRDGQEQVVEVQLGQRPEEIR